MKTHMYHIVRLQMVVALALLIGASRLFADPPTVMSDTKVLAHFDDASTIALDYGANTAITTHGDPEIIDNGRYGKCLRLDADDYISFNGPDNLGSFNEATIMFWVRPHWDNNQGDSHTFCSVKLTDGSVNAYLSLSDGWWESDGSSRNAAYTALLLRFAQRMKTGIVACYI